MKQTANKERLAEVFAMYPSANSVVVTSDGTIFTEKNMSFAKQHAKSSNLTLETITREEFEGTANGSPSPSSQSEDWKKTVKSIDAFTSTIEGFEFPESANTKAEKIAAIEAFLTSKEEKDPEAGEGSEEGSEAKGSDVVPGASDVTDHKTAE